MTQTKSERIHRDQTARARRRIKKNVIFKRTMNIFSKLRRQRKKSK